MTQKAIFFHVVPFLFAALIGTGCGDFTIWGSPPTADAGDGGIVAINEQATLDGSGSTDEDGTIDTYEWAFSQTPEGNQASITQNLAESIAYFTPIVPGDYVVILTVTDNDGLNNSTTVTYEANYKPEVRATANNISPDECEEEVQLFGSDSTDQDGEIISWSWTLIDTPLASSAYIENPNQEVTTLKPDLCGDYIVELTVTDDVELQNTATVTYEADWPRVDPGDYGNYSAGDVVNLDASNSCEPEDPYGEIFSYEWSFIRFPQNEPLIYENDCEELFQPIDSIFTPVACFTADDSGEYELELMVTGFYYPCINSVTFTITVNEP